jgi:hypothetical protein
MDKYPNQIEAFLAEARAADQPGPNDRARIHRSFGETLSRQGWNPPGAPVPEGGTQTAPATLAPAATLGGRIGVTLISLGALVGAAIIFGPSRPAPEQGSVAASPVSNAVVPTPSPLQAVGPSPEALGATTDGARSRHASDMAAPRAIPRTRAARVSASAAHGLSEEIALIAAARSELEDGKPEAALAILSTHAHRFARGALRNERLGLRVLSLCELGRATEAAEARDRFLRTGGGSVLAAQVRAACPASPARRIP